METQGRIIGQRSEGSRSVSINGVTLSPGPSLKVANHSPDGFEWGYGGSGPSQLALAILMHYLPEPLAVDYYQQFKWEVIAKLPRDGFDIPEEQVKEWIRLNVVEI